MLPEEMKVTSEELSRWYGALLKAGVKVFASVIQGYNYDDGLTLIAWSRSRKGFYRYLMVRRDSVNDGKYGK